MYVYVCVCLCMCVRVNCTLSLHLFQNEVHVFKFQPHFFVESLGKEIVS